MGLHQAKEKLSFAGLRTDSDGLAGAGGLPSELATCTGVGGWGDIRAPRDVRRYIHEYVGFRACKSDPMIWYIGQILTALPQMAACAKNAKN